MLLVSIALPGRSETVSFVTTEFPPYVIDEGGVLSGLEVEVVRELSAMVGVQPAISVMPWNRALNLVKAGKADAIFMPVKTSDRAEYLYFTDEPTGVERISVLALADSKQSAKSLDDLKGELFGVVLGYSYGKLFDARADLDKDVSVSNELLFKKLLLKRYPVLVSDEAVIQYVAHQGGQPPLTVVLRLEENPQFIGFAKGLGARGEALAARYAKAMRELKASGKLAEFERRYF
jgi:polar amino acid transport system substrate-binding protein